MLMPLKIEIYQANAKECEDRAREMPPGLRLDLLTMAEHWRKLAAVAEAPDGPKRGQGHKPLVSADCL